MENNGKYALVTGPTSGIGYELAKLLAADGYNLILVSRNADELQNKASELAQQYGIDAQVIAKDLFDKRGAFEVYDEVKAKGISLSILINNAGQGLYGLFEDTSLERELDIIQLNISSLVVLTKLFLKEMVEQGDGKILNLASVASKLPGPWQSVYHGTKAFVLSFSEAIRAEVQDKGVTITALMPGVTDTDFFNKANMENSKAVQGERADPADVAKDGYEALMRGDDKVISGFSNKVQVNMSNVIPDSSVAETMFKKQEPVDK